MGLRGVICVSRHDVTRRMEDLIGRSPLIFRGGHKDQTPGRGDQGGGVLRFEWVPTANRLRRAEEVKA